MPAQEMPLIQKLIVVPEFLIDSLLLGGNNVFPDLSYKDSRFCWWLQYSQVARWYRFSNFESFSLAGAFQGGRINCGYSIVICIDSSS